MSDPNKIDRPKLLAALRAWTHGVLDANIDGTAPADLAALLLATAIWESGGRLDGSGDGGASLGLFHINQPTWATAIGEFDRAKGTVTSDDPDAFAAAFRYQLDYAAPVIKAAAGDVLAGISALDARVRAGEKFVFNPAVDLAVWWSISWQYGQGKLVPWIRSSSDLTAEGWSAYRAATNQPVQEDNARRQRFMAETYLASLENKKGLLAALKERTQLAAADWYALAAKTLNAPRAALDQWVNEKKRIEDAIADSVKDAFHDSVRIFAAAAATSLAGFALFAAASYFILTEPTPNGRRFHPTAQRLALEAGAAALPLLISL